MLKVFLPIILLLPKLSLAQEIDKADTAWVLTSTMLVFFMTLSGLSLFYAGLVRYKNVFSIFLQCFSIVSIVSIIWVVIGYSLAFSSGNAFIGGFSNIMFNNIYKNTLVGTIPESLFATFQMSFAAITTTLIIGGYAERMKFSAVLIFSFFMGYLCVLSCCSLGMGRRLVAKTWFIRFCRWNSCTYNCRCICISSSPCYRTKNRLF